MHIARYILGCSLSVAACEGPERERVEEEALAAGIELADAEELNDEGAQNIELALAITTNQPPATAVTSFHVMTINLCGSACAGDGAYWSRTTAIQTAADYINFMQPTAVGVVEICSKQRDILLSKISGYTYLARYNGANKVCFGDPDNHYMNVLLVKSSAYDGERLRYTYAHQAPSDKIRGEERTLLCAYVQTSQRWVACVTHLTASSDMNAATKQRYVYDQRDEAHLITASIAQSYPVALLGDMNLATSQLAFGGGIGTFMLDYDAPCETGGSVMHLLTKDLWRGTRTCLTKKLTVNGVTKPWSDHPVLDAVYSL